MVTRHTSPESEHWLTVFVGTRLPVGEPEHVDESHLDAAYTYRRSTGYAYGQSNPALRPIVPDDVVYETRIPARPKRRTHRRPAANPEPRYIVAEPVIDRVVYLAEVRRNRKEQAAVVPWYLDEAERLRRNEAVLNDLLGESI